MPRNPAPAGISGVGWIGQRSRVERPIAPWIGAAGPALGTVFASFVVTLTLSPFPAGWVHDRWGPGVPLLVDAILLGEGSLSTALATTAAAVATTYSPGGAGLESPITAPCPH